ncbi:chemotaxis protein [Paenibacillus sp. IHB B 3415]|uniref:methyl-accepting chemotaxis protein n=1 Tax=Paenibacillus sp. IHB B 3415 TaxID=867080 RepID=UPI000575A30A|nr:methyl-accepting chemotaxis protein [Paenibacillus sp. IHB B 3415]KHL96252.1 chemotaxis protein [Paenibacillus sp. IHB B 3415]
MKNIIRSLEDIVNLAPILKAAFPYDVSIAVCDVEKFIAYFPGTSIDLGIRAGQIILADEPLYHALRNDEFSKANVPKEYYGYEFVGTVLPVHGEDGSVCGAVCIQVRRQTELREIADQISVSLNQANVRIGHVAEGSGLLADFSQKLLLQSETTAESVKKSDEVLAVLRKVADQTNLLGINAAIEAAHAGEKGRGFDVVAKEIRKFSKETEQSAQRIRDTLGEIQAAMKQISQSIHQIASVGQEQAASTNEISSFIEEIRTMSEQLNQFAQKL